MNNDVWDDPIPEPVISPCTNNCGVNSSTGFCGGCGRTMTEIRDWPTLSKDEKIEIIKKINNRFTSGQLERIIEL